MATLDIPFALTAEPPSSTDARTARLRHHVDLRVVPGEGAYFVSERAVTVVHGDLASAVASRLDGSATAADIVAALAEHPPEQVHYALAQLARAGVATLESSHRPGPVASTQGGFFEMAGVDADDAERRLQAATVAVRAIGDVDAGLVVDGVGRSGVDTVMAGDGADHRHLSAPAPTLTVVVTDDYLHPDLAGWNDAALAAGHPWLLARPVGSVLWIGPVFRPGETGCWACLAHRLTANRQSHAYLQRRLGEATPIGMSAVRHPLADAIGASLAALEAVRWIAGSSPPPARVVTHDLLSGEVEHHRLTRRPQCPACGDPTLVGAQVTRPVTFSSRPKQVTDDGGHRASTPQSMVDRYADQVSPVTGVVTSVQPITAGPDGLFVFTAGQNLARQTADLRALRKGLRSTSCGKGVSEIQARASAIGEAIERSSGVFQGDEPRRRASYAELSAASDGDAIHPNACMLFSDRQYEQRHRTNATSSGFNTVFDPLEPDHAIDWSSVWSVTLQRHRWLPTQYLYYGYPHSSGPLVAYADSNGNAAGTSLEDAALQGFCELVERDSVALWWYNRLRRPAVDLDSLADPYVDRLRDTYASLGREVWALDLTSDLGIPAVGAFSRRVDAAHEDILIAFGAHLDPRIAVLRALTEMNQFLPAVLPPSAGGAPPAQFPDDAFAAWCRSATLADQPYLVPDPRAAARRVGSWPSLATDDLATDLAWCQATVEERGLELLVLDQTRPDVGLPVVKVIVPGLRHFWARFAPGRIYDVPVALGWLAAPTPEPSLNPVPIFI